MDAMEREHASTEPFNSHNVFNTSPRTEWLYAVMAEVGSRRDRAADATCDRLGWHLQDFAQCDLARRCQLRKEEVVGLRLYTGPMYVHYVSAPP